MNLKYSYFFKVLLYNLIILALSQLIKKNGQKYFKYLSLMIFDLLIILKFSIKFYEI